eukprot:5677463-Pyramimonas_sp.AAC.1
MAEWCPPPFPRSIQISAVAAAIRYATYPLRGEWEPFHARLRDTAWEESTVHSFHRWEAGQWSPPFWQEETSIAQFYHALSSGKRAASFSAAAVAAANRAAASELREAPAAEPPRRPKVQRAVALAPRGTTFHRRSQSLSR